jgi:restriction endonuclease S subunit
MLLNQGRGVALQNLSATIIRNLKIPLPPLDDQIRIATVLSHAEKLLAKRKESIKALDEFLKSIFLEMFGDPVRNEKGWDRVTIRDLIKEAKYGTSKSAEGGKYKYLRMNNIPNYKNKYSYLINTNKLIKIYDPTIFHTRYIKHLGAGSTKFGWKNQKTLFLKNNLEKKVVNKNKIPPHKVSMITNE